MKVAVEVDAQYARHEITPGANKAGRADAPKRKEKDRPAGPESEDFGVAKQDLGEFAPRPRLRRPLPRGQSVQNCLQGLDVESFAIEEAPFPEQIDVRARPA